MMANTFSAARMLPVLRVVVFVCFALLLCALAFYSAGLDVGELFTGIVDGAFLREGALHQGLRWAMPLFITATGVAIAFRAGFFNIGAQGQFYVGSILAAFTAEWLGGAPAWVVVSGCLLAGMVGGALWALWPGLLRLRSGTDEVITTLMGNFLAGLLLVYVTSGPLKDPSGSGQQASSRPIADAYRISDSLGVSPLICALTLAVLVLSWLLANRTALGIVANLAGRNPTMVAWQGARVSRIGLFSFLVSGALAGLAGSIELLGPNGRLASGFLPAHGFTAILIALVAQLSIVGTAVSALFFGALASAALYLPVMVGMPAAAIEVINATIALFITSRARWLDKLFARNTRKPA
ncbi:ABC transporter permease [Variovorax sp. J22G73]|jgi:simple sugar transport system permease protein|uniref:ABC transporter permease n=1 Tax=unclassified Variovorax TaxID=663243 RepID=UPI000D5DC8AA|nr:MULTISPECIES: ABC transporter permease [unclassified Variovorax]MDM0006005.1 ABC transporter permease [Variovorax sp. J22R203]MDM0097971.1 ABC transporter permease [Variovorax sp. J22G73]